MNEYKELIEILRDDEYCGRLDFVYDAADAIEQLVKERDAAIADLKAIASCANCIHFGRHQVHCDAIIPCLYGEESAWEWRGVQVDKE